jgi:hypothetical protein
VNLAMLAPVLVALVGLAAGWFLPRFLSPRRATQTLTASVLLTSVALLAALVQVALAGASEVPLVADAVGWCRALYHGQHGASPVAGGVAAVLLVLALGGMARQWRRLRCEQAAFADIEGVEVVAAAGPVAFAVPGHPGGVVVGACLFEELSPDGRSAVLAHEIAHLEHRHHLYLRAAVVCGAGVPFLRPLVSQVRFMTERWADEVAADRIGSRRVLAETIAHVALMPGGAVQPCRPWAPWWRSCRWARRGSCTTWPRSSPTSARSDVRRPTAGRCPARVGLLVSESRGVQIPPPLDIDTPCP